MPLESDVIEPCSDHREQHQQWEKITDQPVLKLAGLRQATGKIQSDQHGRGDQKSVPAKGERPELKQNGPW